MNYVNQDAFFDWYSAKSKIEIKKKRFFLMMFFCSTVIRTAKNTLFRPETRAAAMRNAIAFGLKT